AKNVQIGSSVGGTGELSPTDDPIRTLSAKGVGDFNSILREIEERAPLRRTTTPEEVGDTAVFLFSDLA
ncbi:SDR family oxidoreductase, partial [Bacillus sp. D-CC]